MINMLEIFMKLFNLNVLIINILNTILLSIYEKLIIFNENNEKALLKNNHNMKHGFKST
jgi:hypothetical protein